MCAAYNSGTGLRARASKALLAKVRTGRDARATEKPKFHPRAVYTPSAADAAESLPGYGMCMAAG
jgi:hypothetical protein